MLTNLENWSSEWQMLFNMDKCHVIHAGSIGWMEGSWRLLRQRRMLG
jgi:hypothetical protein